MADIDIEKRESKPIWAWIIGLLVLIGIIWLIVELVNDGGAAEDENIENVEPLEGYSAPAEADVYYIHHC